MGGLLLVGVGVGFLVTARYVRWIAGRSTKVPFSARLFERTSLDDWKMGQNQTATVMSWLGWVVVAAGVILTGVQLAQ
jgi:hypothetical protein